MLSRMFKSSSTYFAKRPCPRSGSCKLPFCVFNHSLKRPIATCGTSDGAQEELVKRPKTSSEKLPAIGSANSGSAERNVSPTTHSQVLNAVLEGHDESKDLVNAVPKGLPGVGAPATLQQRMKYVTMLVQIYQKLNHKTPKRQAVSDEFNIAKDKTPATYNNSMKSLIRRVQRGESSMEERPQRVFKQMSDDEIYKAVKSLVHSKEKLEREGYVTEVPILTDESTAQSQWKKCDRCGEEFEFSRITDVINCTFHERKKRIENNDRYWECCSEVVGQSQGCKHSDHHVFKAKTADEMQQLIPFRECQPASVDRQRIVGLDCEMGYTSKGMEMIRLTIMDFYTRSVIFDEITKPFGQILDLNTNWSGVSSIPEDAMDLNETMDLVMNTIIDSNTIIVGHGLENDLNTMRLVHHNIVDTAILYPKGMSKKYALKELAFRFLNRIIQTGEHSSEEDSLAAIDIIKQRILEV